MLTPEGIHAFWAKNIGIFERDCMGVTASGDNE